MPNKWSRVFSVAYSVCPLGHSPTKDEHTCWLLVPGQQTSSVQRLLHANAFAFIFANVQGAEGYSHTDRVGFTDILMVFIGSTILPAACQIDALACAKYVIEFPFIRTSEVKLQFQKL